MPINHLLLIDHFAIWSSFATFKPFGLFKQYLWQHGNKLPFLVNLIIWNNWNDQDHKFAICIIWPWNSRGNKLTIFSVRQLLHEVMNSNVFPLEEIKEAVEVMHNRVLKEYFLNSGHCYATGKRQDYNRPKIVTRNSNSKSQILWHSVTCIVIKWNLYL